MKWVWGCKQEYVHLLVQARGVRFPTSRLLRMNRRTPCWECFAKKTAVKPLLRRYNQRCLPFAQSQHGFEVKGRHQRDGTADLLDMPGLEDTRMACGRLACRVWTLEGEMRGHVARTAAPYRKSCRVCAQPTFWTALLHPTSPRTSLTLL